MDMHGQQQQHKQQQQQLQQQQPHVDATELLNLLESNEPYVFDDVKALILENLNSTREAWLPNGLVDYYMATHSERALDIVAGVREPHDKHLFDKLCECMKCGSRLYTLLLLSHVVRKQPSWLRKIIHHPLFNALLQCLKTDTDIPALMTGVLIVTTLLPIVPAAIGPYLHDVFDIFTRLASWSTRKPGSVPEIHILHLHVGVYALFHRLYGMYPCNFLAYLRSQFAQKYKERLAAAQTFHSEQGGNCPDHSGSSKLVHAYKQQMAETKSRLETKERESIASRSRVAELVQLLQTKDVLINTQKRTLENLKDVHKDQIEAVEGKYETVKSQNRCLETEILRLYEQVEAMKMEKNRPRPHEKRKDWKRAVDKGDGSQAGDMKSKKEEESKEKMEVVGGDDVDGINTASCEESPPHNRTASNASYLSTGSVQHTAESDCGATSAMHLLDCGSSTSGSSASTSWVDSGLSGMNL